ncbi:EpsG family protein [Myroides odoratimimus]|uniref:EpsG family protein n=1 Tax=Myroides odoratimimus TaxID=76832 RepID=UPI002576920C|nr:EpsG family protein [Myroides odoratimimus]MDM1039132.1 EpsG family protein [Myroides odoratimimus]MDM1053319.1 EpsG family protein [Myroides odoratimimus]
MAFALFERNVAKGKFFYVSYFILLLLFVFSSGLRDMIGGYDVYIYRAAFLSKDILNNEYGFEIGFNYLLLLFKAFSDSEFFMFFGLACIIGVSHFKIFRTYNDYFFFAIFIYFCKFYLMSYVYLRQGVAMGIVWYSLRFVIKREFLKYCFIIFIAVLFHKSALIFFPIYFFYKKYTRIVYIGVFFAFASFVVLPVFDPILAFVARLDARYEDYGNNLSYGVNIFYLIEAFFCFIIFLFVYNDSEKKYSTKFNNFIINGYFIYIILLLISVKQAVFIRMTWYYLVFYCICFAVYVYQTPIRYRIVKPILIIVFSLLFIRMLLVWDNGDFMPYKSIFDNTVRNSMWKHLL